MKCAARERIIQTCLILITTAPSAALASDKIYWSDRQSNTITRSELDGSHAEVLVSGLGQARGVAVDFGNSMLYWADNGTNMIQRSMLDGSNIETLVTGLNFPAGITLDVPRGKMYWADASNSKVQRANLDGSGVEDFVTGLDGPYYVTIDLTNDQLYWTDQGTRKIQRIDLDGTNQVDLVTGLGLPRGIDFDLSGGKMYWADRTKDVVQRADLDGQNVETLHEATPSSAAPHGVALDVRRGHVYWLDNGLVTLKRMDLDGTNVKTILDGDSGLLTRPWQIVLDLRNDSVCPPSTIDCDPVEQAARIDAVTDAIRSGSNDAQFDMNRDGQVSEADRSFLIKFGMNTLLGDSNLNGRFDTNDFVTAFPSGTYEIGVPNSATWRSGDWNGDGQFTTTDFVAAFQSGRYEENTAPRAVPEPTGIIVVLCPLVAIVMRVRSSRGL